MILVVAPREAEARHLAAGLAARGLGLTPATAGTLVAATETVEHDYMLRFVTRPLPRFPGHGPTLARLRALPPAREYALHFGAVASGDEDVVDAARAAGLAAATGALAVAWEGAGGARACALSGTPFVEVRAVTDAATADAAAHFAARLPVAMANLADLLARSMGGR